MFGSMMGDLEDDPIFGHHMRSMRQMNTMMSSMFADPFAGMFGGFDPTGMMGSGGSSAALTMGHHQMPHQHQFMPMLPMQQQMFQHQQRNAPPPPGMMMPFGFGMGAAGGLPGGMAGMNRLLMGSGMGDGAGGGASFSSSQVISMSRGADGRPQVYKATSSTKTGPGGVKETQKTVQDSRSGLKKMAIGHHIGERAHVIEREKNYHTGHEEERQDFINLEEEEAEEFNREFAQRARSLVGIGGRRGSSHGGRGDAVAAIMPAPSSSRSSPAPLAIMGPSQGGQQQPSSSSPQSDSQLPNKPKPRIAEEPLTGKPPSGNSRPASTSRRPPSKLARRPIKSSSANTPTAGQANTTGTSSSSSSTPSIHPHPYGVSGSSSGASRRRVKGNSPSHHHQQQPAQQMQYMQQQQQQLQQQQQQHTHHNSQIPHQQQYHQVIHHQHTPRNGDAWIEEPL